MLSTNLIMLFVTGASALFLLRPKLMNAPLWRATMTPLASIIGSGFLVSGPILAHVAGNWAWLAMAGLCLLAYLFGTAIRYNIKYVEPAGVNTPPKSLRVLEKLSEFALALAYFVSVAYYLNLFAAFTLRADHITDPKTIALVATCVIFALGIIGALRGLRGLERIEAPAVGMKLALIIGLTCALAAYMGHILLSGQAITHPVHHDTGRKELGIFLGLVILVQGFETSRYLADSYDAKTRIRTMRWAQLISTGIYIAFIALITPFFMDKLPKTGGETAIIDMLTPLGTMVAPLIIFAALMSQFSAAVADLNGASGLMSTLSQSRISTKLGYFIAAMAAIGITWLGNVYTIITYASKAFALYYGLQCLVAIICAKQRKDFKQMIVFILAFLIAISVLVFGLPAEGS